MARRISIVLLFSVYDRVFRPENGESNVRELIVSIPVSVSFVGVFRGANYLYPYLRGVFRYDVSVKIRTYNFRDNFRRGAIVRSSDRFAERKRRRIRAAG